MREAGLFAALLFCATAFAKPCPTKDCIITGNSEVQGKRIYVQVCPGELRQLEFREDAKEGGFIDPISRKEIAKCSLDPVAKTRMIEAYQSKRADIENPKCFLTQWKGQMMVSAFGIQARCSFKMNPKRADEFKRKTGVSALYQCEKDYFLSMSERAAPAVYKKSKDTWELACRAAIKSGETVEDIKWDTPPDYYVPEADASGL